MFLIIIFVLVYFIPRIHIQQQSFASIYWFFHCHIPGIQILIISLHHTQ